MFGAQAHQHKVFVRFNRQPVQDQEASLREGRPVFRDVIYIEKRVPGDNSNVVHRPARDADYQEFAGVYEKFKAGEGERLVGTPLKEWPAITRSLVEELAHFHCFTVEQLAEMSDSALQNVGPLMAVRQKARDAISKAKDEAPLQKLRADLEARDNTIATLQQQFTECLADLRSLRESMGAKPVIQGKGKG